MDTPKTKEKYFVPVSIPQSHIGLSTSHVTLETTTEDMCEPLSRVFRVSKHGLHKVMVDWNAEYCMTQVELGLWREISLEQLKKLTQPRREPRPGDEQDALARSQLESTLVTPNPPSGVIEPAGVAKDRRQREVDNATEMIQAVGVVTKCLEKMLTGKY